ncbi:MAG: pyridoxamine 5'-phosphate oxidase family protein [Actinomycetota bacterium]
MSIPVSLGELPEQVGRFGPAAFLLTVGSDLAPRATAVRLQWEGLLLVAGAGRHTAANIEVNDLVALLWPVEEETGHTLIVDGWAEVRVRDGSKEQVAIQPSKAILHLTSRAWA